MKPDEKMTLVKQHDIALSKAFIHALRRFADKVKQEGLDAEHLLDNLEKVKRELARERLGQQTE